MPISLISGGNLTGTATNGGDVTITLPTLLRNDVVYLVAGRVGGPTVSTAGYTQVGTVTSGTHVVRVFRKVMGVTPDTSVTVTGSANAADAMAVALYCLRGVDFITPEDATATTASGSSVNPDNPAITTVTANAWVLAAASSQVSDNTITTPTGYLSLTTNNANDTNASTSALSYIVEVTPALEDPPSYTNWSTGAWGAITVAVRPAIDQTVNPTGVSGTGLVGTATMRGNVSNSVTGLAATGLVGTATMRGNVSNSVTGLSATGQVGSIQATIISRAFPTGVVGTGQVGTVSTNLVPVTGVSATAQVGSVQAGAFATVLVTGVSAQGLIGQVDVPIIRVSVSGVSAFGFIGSTSQWITIDPSQDPTWNGVSPSTSPGWSPLSPGQVPGWIDVAPNQNPSYNLINPTQSPGWTDTSA